MYKTSNGKEFIINFVLSLPITIIVTPMYGPVVSVATAVSVLLLKDSLRSIRHNNRLTPEKFIPYYRFRLISTDKFSLWVGAGKWFTTAKVITNDDFYERMKGE